MHEMSIAINVVEIAEETARKENAKKINEITLELGVLSGVIPDALEFCFESACKGTMAEGAKLDLIQLPANAFCEKCQFPFQSNEMVANCPQCNELIINVQGGRELRVKSINVD